MSDKLSDEDKALFHSSMQGVKPLKVSLKKISQSKVPPLTKTLKPRFQEKLAIPHIELSSHYIETVGPDSILSYCKCSIPRKRLNQLKNGQIPWQARLDLHGLGPDTARDTLVHFIDQQNQCANRCLLIIHGKGSRHGEAPILKNHVNHWLKQLPYVLAFHSALPRDGGSGALYVLLQRQRNSFD